MEMEFISAKAQDKFKDFIPRRNSKEKGNIRSITARQSMVESSLDSAMIPLAVPFRRKSASFTLLMKASCITFPSASNLTSCSSGQSEKWTTSRHGSSALSLPPFSSSSSSSSSSSAASSLCDDDVVTGFDAGACVDTGNGAAPENKSWRRPSG